jgi:hypothetical protein
VRFTQRQTAGALAGQRGDSVAACAAAAAKLIQSKFHVRGVQPTDLAVLDVQLDGPSGRQRALGGHIDADPSQPIATILQVEPLPASSTVNVNAMDDQTNWIGLRSAGTGTPYKITAHCQEGDTSSPTSGRQYEIEFGVKFGL